MKPLDTETKRLMKQLRAAITARSRETVDDLRQQLECRRQEWVSTQGKEDNDRLIKLAAHQPAALFDLLKGEGQAQQLTHAVRDKDGKLQTKADEVHARLNKPGRTMSLEKEGLLRPRSSEIVSC